ncbi:zinc dependent phospholipase C family protein [Thalassobacillus pellis]|uniref:zinc dependent phospholipase C family protein n=1 Tax=Thalassobacillus pellis TaxID=748008 RepID=UPI0019611881|nr:zinc dependent phospholipase C family protein [Thalassobacillus pellis]MBM7551121.1 hypothetical protein [Thalassobacillus pellis]
MPNVWTHIHFAEDILDSVEHPDSFGLVTNFVNLGAQGPDPFFYHRFWPFLKNKEVDQVGMKLHTEKCGDFLLDLIEAGRTAPLPVRAYIAGFVTHHILDRNTHPYIHYRAGYEGNNHQRLETIIDTIILERIRNIKTWKTPVYKEIDVGKHLNRGVIKVVEEAIKRHFPVLVEDLPAKFIQQSYRDMKLALKILYDPYGWKNKLLRSLVSPFSHRPVSGDVDYLNECHTEWKHPATGEIRIDSFFELYDNARKEGMEILTLLLHYWNEKEAILFNEIESLLSDISYDTGEPLHRKLTNQWSQPIV